ncbi:MAG: hypothetical protein R3C03_02815 [Pirellulaceae bacterium]
MLFTSIWARSTAALFVPLFAGAFIANGGFQEKTEADAAKGETAAKVEQEGNEGGSAFEPVDDMHHFMEYVCEPSYRALKDVLQNEPEDRRVWRQIRSASMILAETSSIVAERAPEENAELWKEISAEVYKHSRAIFDVSSKREFAAVKASYESMVDQCNRCHNEFENGRHQLEK